MCPVTGEYTLYVVYAIWHIPLGQEQKQQLTDDKR